MNFDWTKIKERLIANLTRIFAENTPAYSNIEEGVELFRKTVIYKTGIAELDGLPRVLLPALQEAYITNRGEPAALGSIASSLEPYLKKLDVLVNNKRFEDLPRGLIKLYKALDLNTDLTNQTTGGYPQLDEGNLLSFRGKDEYLEYLCLARNIRNEVHNSPDWDEADVFTNLKSILVVYVYATLKYKNELIRLPQRNIVSSESVAKIDTDENKMLFDFVSFGNTSTEIKTQVVDAYILHYLKKTPNVSLSEIRNEANVYFKNSISERFYERRINSLIKNNQVEYSDDSKVKLRVSEKENKRLNDLIRNFAENKELFSLYLDDIITKYNISGASDELLEKLLNFFEANFNIDVAEAYDRGIEIGQNENEIYCDFIKYLKSITDGETKAQELFRELLQLCNDSDFLMRLSASKVFSKLTNPDKFQNYLRLQKRIVYVDTQIILHALCLGYGSNIKYENIFYKITDELIEFASENENIELKVSRLYLAEVVYQLKLALLLIPFEDFGSGSFSNNVFYLFYNFLKENELLEEHHNDFAEFLKYWFLVEEDDVYRSDFEEVAKSNLQDLLTDELHIETVTLPMYENRDVAVHVLEDTIKTHLLNPKPYSTLKNDALMVCHLSDSDYHQTEPFFLTWDKSFTPFRKDFKNRFNRLEPISWHLFNPSKFLNHMALIDFKIDAKSISNDYLSIIDGFDIHEKTQTLFDSMNKFLDLKGISKGQRRKYIQITQNIFNEKEFSYDIKPPEESKQDKVTEIFATLVEDIIHYYQGDQSPYSINDYRTIMLEEEAFIGITNIIVKEIKSRIDGKKVNKTYFKEIDKIIEKLK